MACPTRTATSGSSGSGACSRPRSTRTPTGSSSAAWTWGRATRARSSAAPGTSAPGATVAVALPGARLPGGLQLEQRKVRGELSDGMILAEDEVELGSDHSGIMVLPGDRAGDAARRRAAARRGGAAGRVDRQPARPALDLRPRAGGRGALRPVPCGHARGTVPGTGPGRTGRGSGRRLRRLPALHRPRLSRRVRSGQSPIWLRARLTNAGMRPISNVVDVTNYVMLALGNPLHAFDLAKLAGGRIVVRRAKPGETIRTLDGVERKLEPEDLMIADAERSVALAGIMGGEETEISDETTEVLLEAANFEPTRDLPQLRAAAAAHGGLEPLGEGRRPVPGRAGRESRHAAAGRDRRGDLGGRRRRPRRPARAAGDPLPARARRRADRARDAAPPTSSAGSSASASRAAGRRRRSHLAGAAT